ncbi:hypothetical protein KQX54_004646 [Cotesia glomerata]|uniref:EB domain-containing protein n=1 Tax=Cotesia glomerata TaxID=32391 RepID=A0AAV7IQL4_COTGL|nr:hypothetical protein KQX54_004646 [Cotesia glomerata]
MVIVDAYRIISPERINIMPVTEVSIRPVTLITTVMATIRWAAFPIPVKVMRRSSHHQILKSSSFIAQRVSVDWFSFIRKAFNFLGIGSRCATDENCSDLDKTQCRAGKCKCVRGYWLDKNICRPVTNVICADDSDCEERGTKCILEQCVLPEDFFDESNAHNSNLYTANKCKQVLNVYCKDDYQCTDYYKAKCFFNNCSIPNDFFVPENAHNVSLYAATYLGDVCRTDHHCRDLENAHCFEDECRCQKGFAKIHDKCYKLSDVNCTHDSTCKKYGHDYWCLLNACHQEGIYFDTADIHQWRAKYYKDVCQKDHHCRNLDSSICSNGKCIFLFGLKLHSDVPKPTVTNCTSDSDCWQIKTFCFLNTCRTSDDFFNTSTIDEFNAYAANIWSCRFDHHCRNLQNTHCLKKKCNCLPGYEYVEGICQKAINVTCTDDSECLLPRSYCFINTCLYPEDFLAPANGYNISVYATKHIDGFCQTDYHCREIEHSKCYYRRCICKNKHSSNGGICLDTTGST